jgi:hypothetical protein
MLSFNVSGQVGCILVTAPDELTLAISAELIRDGDPPRVVWVLCVARDRALRAHILANIREGDAVLIEGDIEPRRRHVRELSFHSVGFVARAIERMPAPPPGASQ